MDRIGIPVLSLFAALAVLFLLFMVHYVIPLCYNIGKGAHYICHNTLGAADVSLIAFFSLVGAMSIWLIIGIVLSELKKRAKAQVVSKPKVFIETSRWDYKLVTALNFGEEPESHISECEHWAMIAHGICSLLPVRTLLLVPFFIIWVVGWFVGGRPDFASAIERGDPGYIFRSGRQFVGPRVGVLLLIGGLVSGLLLSGGGAAAGRGIAHANWPGIGMWTGVVMLGILVTVFAIIIFVKVTKEAGSRTKPLFSLAISRLAGVCRPVEYIKR